jgi:hypothetical protein
MLGANKAQAGEGWLVVKPSLTEGAETRKEKGVVLENGYNFYSQRPERQADCPRSALAVLPGRFTDVNPIAAGLTARQRERVAQLESRRLIAPGWG